MARRYFAINQGVTDIPARYNIAPGSLITTFHADPGHRVVCGLSTWGLRPSWAREGSPRPINIRSETAATSPFTREAFAHRRCVVALDGWYEWRATEEGKEPFYITLSDPDPGEVLFAAGLWEPAARLPGSSCAVFTEPAGTSLAHIHDRPP